LERRSESRQSEYANFGSSGWRLSELAGHRRAAGLGGAMACGQYAVLWEIAGLNHLSTPKSATPQTPASMVISRAKRAHPVAGVERTSRTWARDDTVGNCAVQPTWFCISCELSKLVRDTLGLKKENAASRSRHVRLSIASYRSLLTVPFEIGIKAS
jgi:hypothetical protein